MCGIPKVKKETFRFENECIEKRFFNPLLNKDFLFFFLKNLFFKKTKNKKQT